MTSRRLHLSRTTSAHTSPSSAGTRAGAGATSLPKTTTQLARRVQRHGPGAPEHAALEIAAQGTAGTGQALPHADVIQGAFGNHSVGDVRAHVGGDAAAASDALGADGYATGNDVAFAAAPSLHLAAHEAAHVVQQRGGVQLSGGVGAAGDRFEQHADQVADAVVRGESAAGLLDEVAGPGPGAGGAGLQRQDRGERSLQDIWMSAISPEIRFPQAEQAEQLKMLRSATEAEQAAWLALISESRAKWLLGALRLEIAVKFRLLEKLPLVLHLLSLAEVRELFDEPHGSYEAGRNLFTKLTFAQQLQTLNQLDSRRIGRVYPKVSTTMAEHAALLTSLSDPDLGDMLSFWEEVSVLQLTYDVPPHVADRVRRLAAPTHPAFVVAPGDVGADDRAEAEREAEADDKPAPVRRASRQVPELEEWRELPPDDRIDAFSDAGMTRRMSYLTNEKEVPHRMVASLRGTSELLETLAAYAKYHDASSLVRGLPVDLLVAATIDLGDWRPLVAIYPLASMSQRRLILTATSPAHLAKLLSGVDDSDKNELWLQAMSAGSAETLTAAMRRMSDDDLEDLHFQIDPGPQQQLLGILPPERKGLFARADE